VPGDQEQVGRLDVEVLEVVLGGDDVQRLGRVREVGQQFVARDARLAAGAALVEPVLELPVGQLHHHDEFAADLLDALQGEQERVADGLDLLERGQLLPEALAAPAILGLAADELDGLVQPAGRLALPHLAEPAATQWRKQPVARQRLGAGGLGVVSVGAAFGGRDRGHGRCQRC
jgi:hypothetical protein